VIKLVPLQRNRCNFSVRTSGDREKHGYNGYSGRLYLSNDEGVSIGSLHYYREGDYGLSKHQCNHLDRS
jgi:hypothetical protein